uniref:Uncharacterized protein n=1 Tax=Trypanosoma congolense (strain IL3000) TaxID=1068625 RepID=G0ULW6_TRYCI|nr:conserved hypothetical protein [Trypanosoma congolense IL3000]
MPPKSQQARSRYYAPGDAYLELTEEDDTISFTMVEEDESEPTGRRSFSVRNISNSPHIRHKRHRSESTDNPFSGSLENSGSDGRGTMGGTVDEAMRTSLITVNPDEVNWSMPNRNSEPPRDGKGFFHDLNSMRPVRVRLGVCQPSGGFKASSSTLLLKPHKFFTLPEEKGGSDVMGWSVAFSGLSLELPKEGVYNKASASITLMLPP